MKIKFSHERDKERILTSFNDLIEENYILTLATVSKGQPCSCNAFYVFDDEFNLYIWTGKGTLHSRNMGLNPKVAISIYNSSQKWGSDLKGLQAIGTAKVVIPKDLLNAGGLYLKRYVKSSELVKNAIDFHKKVFDSRIYKIQLKDIKVFDEESFGKEGYRGITIGRK